MVEFTIFGEPASKANSRRLVHCRGRMISIKSQKALDYVKQFIEQCPKLETLMEGPLCVEITVYYKTRRPDLDESVILDAMQGLIYGNDRQVEEKHVFRRLDKEQPRSHIRVSSIQSSHSPSGK